MRQYVERMLKEKEDLESKIKKAKKVIESKPFDMDKTQTDLLNEQIKIMGSYLDVLNKRIVYEKTQN